MNQAVVKKLDNTHAANMERVKTFAKQIGEAIAERYSNDDPDELMGKLQELATLQSTASYCQAMANRLYNDRIADLCESPAYSKLSATDKKMIFAGRASEEIYYVELCERYSRSLTHAIESIRSILSFKKSEFELAKFQQT